MHCPSKYVLLYRILLATWPLGQDSRNLLHMLCSHLLFLCVFCLKDTKCRSQCISYSQVNLTGHHTCKEYLPVPLQFSCRVRGRDGIILTNWSRSPEGKPMVHRCHYHSSIQQDRQSCWSWPSLGNRNPVHTRNTLIAPEVGCRFPADILLEPLNSLVHNNLERVNGHGWMTNVH